DDLESEQEPMAYPIFGRGRALFALVGKGINRETIDEACSFVVGPCSCVVKELNPGQDILISAAWGDVTPVDSSLDEQLQGAGSKPGTPVAIAPGLPSEPKVAAISRLEPATRSRARGNGWGIAAVLAGGVAATCFVWSLLKRR
ncbi:MAG TPA: hypothetical protein VK530_14845, partial [Candidatus Acidoferrum sp.]|nr:hypothetical protein [Candidatus Acidoferrum sp.]